MAAPVSTLIFTLNEEPNLPYCLDTLGWCADTIVVDSYSTDGTETICRERGIKFVQRRFEGFGTTRNWALDNLPIRNEWVLILDADERVPSALASEIMEVVTKAPETVGAFRVRRRFHLWGRWLRYSSLYPTWVVRLVHKNRVRYANRGHSETQSVRGQIWNLKNDIIDENHKGIDEWFGRQNRYSREEAEYELKQESTPTRWRDFAAQDPLVRRAALKQLTWRMPGRGVLYFCYSYLLRGGFLEGRDGFMLCLMRSIYQSMVSIKKHDGRRTQPEHAFKRYDT